MATIKKTNDSLPIEIMALASLTPHPRNPRSIDAEAQAALVESIKRFGLYQLPVFNKQNGFLVVGHQRVKALASLGYKKCEVAIVALDEAAHIAMMLADNNPFLGGRFTHEATAMLADIEEADLGALMLDHLADHLLILNGDWGEIASRLEIADEESVDEVTIVLRCNPTEQSAVRAAIQEIFPQFSTLRFFRPINDKQMK